MWGNTVAFWESSFLFVPVGLLTVSGGNTACPPTYKVGSLQGHVLVGLAFSAPVQLHPGAAPVPEKLRAASPPALPLRSFSNPPQENLHLSLNSVSFGLKKRRLLSFCSLLDHSLGGLQVP